MQRNVCVEAPYVGKAKTKHKARFNNHKKVHTGPTEKNIKYHSKVVMNIMGNAAIMGLMIHSSHQLNNVKKRVVERKGNILAAQP